MGFFDFFKKKSGSPIIKSAVDDTPKVNLVSEYSNKLIESIKPENNTVFIVKKQLADFAKQNKMSDSQLRTAETKALMLYQNVDSSIISSDVPLEPEILDIIKYIRVLDVLDKFSVNKKKELCQQKWDEMIQKLIPKMNDTNFSVLNALFSSLDLRDYLNVSDEKHKISKAHTLYNITENHILPEYESNLVDIVYKREEKLHYAISTQILKKKTRTQAINYKGFHYTLRITKNFRYRSGTIIPKAVKEDYWDTESEGIFWITNQRVGFLGNKSFSIPLTKIMSINYDNEKFLVYKEGRQNPFIIYIPYDFAEEPMAVLSELINSL